MHPDGRFSVKGRATDSVRFKINMFIIWPSTIESAISTLPGVRSIKVHYLSTLKGLNVYEFNNACVLNFLLACTEACASFNEGVFNQLSQPLNFFALRSKVFLGYDRIWVRTRTASLETVTLMKMMHKLDNSQKNFNTFVCYLLSFYERIVALS